MLKTSCFSLLFSINHHHRSNHQAKMYLCALTLLSIELKLTVANMYISTCLIAHWQILIPALKDDGFRMDSKQRIFKLCKNHAVSLYVSVVIIITDHKTRSTKTKNARALQ